MRPSVLLIVLALVAQVATAGAASGGPFAAGDMARLRAVGAPVAVPGFVPPGFRLVRVQTAPCPRDAAGHPRPSCKFGPGYTLYYAKNARSSFQVEETGGGIGDTGDDYRTTVGTSLFGPVTLYFGTGQNGFGAMKPSPPALLRVAQPHLISEWAGKGPFYHIIGEGMTPNDAAQVLRSLRWLR